MWRDILFLSSISLSNLTIKHLCTLVTKSYLSFLTNLKTNCNYPFPVCSRGQEVDIQTNLMTQNYILNDSQYLLGHAANKPATTGVWFDIPHFGDALNLYSITSRMGWKWSSLWSGTTARWVSWRMISGRRVEEGGEESCLTFPSQSEGVGADARGVVKWWSGDRHHSGWHHRPPQTWPGCGAGTDRQG